jgi:preprotein translocase subunit SecA
VLAAGGLYILGTERHESRRIDNQLRGLAGRQGDAGASRIYLSMEDSLMRIFASERMTGMMKKLGMERGESIEHPWVNRAIENAQRKVEGRNFDMRKQLLEYDDVANDQRKVIYEQRNELMDEPDVSATINNIRKDVVETTIRQYIPIQSLEEQWDVEGLEERLKEDFLVELPIATMLKDDEKLHEENLVDKIQETVEQAYQLKEQMVGGDVLRQFEKAVMLQTLDGLWKDHLAAMDHLRQGIHLRGYAQKNPKQEFKRESFELFQELLISLKSDVIVLLSKIKVQAQEDVDAIEEQRRQAEATELEFQHASAAEESQGQPLVETVIRETEKVGRNEPCPCNSGKKYKQCHGKLT